MRQNVCPIRFWRDVLTRHKGYYISLS
jgi:hypothetical protein